MQVNGASAAGVYPRPVADGAGARVARDQATRGEFLYASKCASCHGDDLSGGGVPPLAGNHFLKRYPDRRSGIKSLYSFIETRMPLQEPGSLSPREAAQVTAYILQVGRYPIASVWQTLVPVAGLTEQAAPGSEAAAAQTRPTVEGPSDAELLQPKPADWLMYNRDYQGRRFADLGEINTTNVGKLAPACAFQTGETGAFQASPLIYDGMLYVTTARHTYAIDAKTCRKIWDAPSPTRAELPMLTTRGAAIHHGRLFRSTPDGHVRALDLKTGAFLWDVQISDPSRGYWLTAAPIAFGGLVYMGEAGADFGNDGHLYGIDEDSGTVKWTFSAIPTGDAQGAASWQLGAAHGGGSTWSTFTLDPEAALLYAPLGNPAPDFDGAARPGANLFTDSVVALEATSGKLSWYAQQVPHDTHDWDTGDAPTLFEQDGKRYMAVGSKAGYVYVYDRVTHQLQNRIEVSEHSHVEDAVTTAGVHVCPGWLGGVEWNGLAYSPQDKLLFVNSVHWCGVYKKASAERFVPNAPYYGGEYISDPQATAYGWTRAIDVASGKEAWAVRASTPMIAAVTATAGGLLLTGELSGDFKALDAKTGKELYRFNTGGAIAGGVSVYAVNGKEYIAVASGNASRSTVWGTTGAATVFVFALPSAAP